MNKWTRDEILVALNLYTRLDFGQFHSRHPLVIATANALQRTPGTVAMKLCNLASLDPAIVASGRGGLANASRLDRELWAEFMADSERVGLESEQVIAQRVPALLEPSPSSGSVAQDLLANYATERNATVAIRIGQRFFRRALLSSYGGRCCMTGLAEPALLVASHIKP